MKMKDSMNTLLIVFLIAGIAYLAYFHGPRQETVPELKRWISAQLVAISEKLENDIALDRQGHFSHPGRQSFEPRGSITYTLLDKNLSRYELSQFSELTKEHIKSTPGYKALTAKAVEMGLAVTLDEVEVEGDGVNSWNELDEYVYDIPRYYTVTVSGWSV
jgi:hypothetical protein